MYSRFCDRFVLDPFEFRRIILGISSQLRERYLGRFGARGWERRLRAWGVVPCALGRPWVTVRAHYGALPSMAGRGRVKGGETCLDGELARAWLGSRSQGRRNRRDGTLRGVAVCLCFPAIREISRGRYQGAPFGVPPPSFLVEGGSPNPPFTQIDLRAAMTLAWCWGMRCAQLSPSSRQAGPITPGDHVSASHPTRPLRSAHQQRRMGPRLAQRKHLTR